ncbi:ParB/RepB/Spo0J family partition protein [Desulfovibrio mangrovi]|uniref:ParB/RepB/Spo0J family partition protein n=1 Tax=Desulfovibrio mangrovi TaxID=2976983 RepID=UPI002248451E|nr:ParB/RepB/Spo0J family partition protein [Desulfovibrio mangrovi]UZP66558.1 ParB/RepB/Spo0J family partition protein [Desulfovibrio mangrovi]
MAGAPRGLGRGLDALFKANEEPAAAAGATTPNTLPLRMLKPNPNQPRKAFTEEALEELASSIKAQGVLQPLLVRPLKDGDTSFYEIVAGERRWRASRMVGLREVPVIIKEMTDLETLAVGLIENLQREDLNPMEEALGMQELKEKFGLSQEDLSQKLGKSRSSIANTLRLLQLSESARGMLQNGTISAGHARTLLAVGEDVRAEMLDRIIKDMLTVREAEAMAQYWKAHGELPPASGAEKGKEAKGARPAVSLSERMVDIHTQLSSVFSGKVAVSGTEEKGKVTLSFSSQDELNELLARLGVTVNG